MEKAVWAVGWLDGRRGEQSVRGQDTHGRGGRPAGPAPPVVVYDDCSLREAADHMVRHDVGRLPVMSRKMPGKLVRMVTRSDLLRAHRKRIDEAQETAEPTVVVPFLSMTLTREK